MIKISNSELEVMKVIWKRKETTSIEIIEDLKDKNWNFNTTRTLIKRLLEKGAIEITQKKGKTYTYKAAIDENKYKAEATRELLKKLYNNSIEEFVLEYCDDDEVSNKEKREIIEQINQLIFRKEKEQKNNI
jgi:BlaI family penicillinase repressor